MICLIRNPLDVFYSFANLGNTMSHSVHPEFSYDKDYPQWWDWWVRLQAENHQRYFDTLRKHCEEKKCPIYFVRYEDLLTKPKEELTGIMSFILDLDSLEGTNVQRRIDEVTASKDAGQPDLGKFNKNVDKYTQEQIDYIKSKNADHLYYFGYTNSSESTEKNPYAFFNFEEHDAKNVT